MFNFDWSKVLSRKSKAVTLFNLSKISLRLRFLLYTLDFLLPLTSSSGTSGTLYRLIQQQLRLHAFQI